MPLRSRYGDDDRDHQFVKLEDIEKVSIQGQEIFVSHWRR